MVRAGRQLCRGVARLDDGHRESRDEERADDVDWMVDMGRHPGPADQNRNEEQQQSYLA